MTAQIGVDQLIAEFKRRLKTAELSGEVSGAGAEALEAAKAANQLRNRIVHDMWLPDSGSQSGPTPTWVTFQRFMEEHPPYAFSSIRNLESLIGAHATLVRTRLRVSGLFMALHELLPWLSDVSRRAPSEPPLPRYVALMRDQFTLESNGDFEIAQAD